MPKHHADPVTVPPDHDRDYAHELAALNEIRLEHDWTFDELGDAMTRAGCPMKARTVARLLVPPYTARAYDRTIYQIRRYLDMWRRESEIKRIERDERRARAASRE